MTRNKKLPQIAVIGSSEPEAETIKLANNVGKIVASLGAVLICGGLGGTMEAAARAAKEAGGLTVGILPDYPKSSANPYIDIAISTGMGHARNVIVVASGDLVVALPGSHGTRSEISIALKLGIPVVGFNAWGNISGVREVSSVSRLKKELMPFF